MAELRYEFRKRMLEVHKKNRRTDKPLGAGQIEITEDWRICVPTDDEFLVRVGRDLEDYFFVSMNVEVHVSAKPWAGKRIEYVIDETMEAGAYAVDVREDRVRLIGQSARAAA